MTYPETRPIRPARMVFLTLVLALAGPVSLLSAQGVGEGRAILVTGASSGIGLSMTEVLSSNGFFVYAGARSADDLERLDRMVNVKGVRLDVTVQDEIDAAVELIRSEGRGLFGLVNNAGVAVVGPLIEMPEEDMAFQLDVNLFGPYRVTKAFAPLLIESKGRVMNTSSLSGIVSGGFLGAYSMSKHGVEAYTDALAAELRVFDVAVSAVEPGNYRSRIVASMRERMEAAGYTPENSRYGRSMYDLFGGPADRSHLPPPDDVALAALDFMTTDAPRRRYLVVPNQREAEVTIRKAMEELVQLNGEHPFSYEREELIRILDETLERVLGQEGGAGQKAALQVHTVVVDGHPMAVWEKSPENPKGTIILLHGRTWSSLPDFDLQVPGEELSLMDGLVSEGFSTYAVDARGYGGTPRDETGWLTPDRAARDVIEILGWVRERTGQRPALFGWSYGSMVAQLTAQRVGESVSALALFGYPIGPDQDFSNAGPEPEEPPMNPTTATAAASDFRIPGSISQAAIDEYVRHALEADPVRVDWRALSEWGELDPSQIMVPTLLIQGEGDPMAPTSRQAAFFSRLGTADRMWVTIPGGDHAAHLEAPRALFIHALTSFLNRPH